MTSGLVPSGLVTSDPVTSGLGLRLTVLSGGLGGARLALAVREAGWPGPVTFVTNVADDWMVGDLPVCPDTDAVIYALSGRFDEVRGWGIVGDRFPGPRPGEPPWFGIGDLDRATHEFRRARIERGDTLAEAVAALVDLADMPRGLRVEVLPVSCDPIRTLVRSEDTWRAFQEWMVRDGGPPVDEVRWDGLDGARPSPGVVDAIDEAELVVLASSSPVASLAPVVGVPAVRVALERRSLPTVALSPVVAGRPALTDRDRHREHARRSLMEAVGFDHSPLAAAGAAAALVSHVALDPVDQSVAASVEALGVHAIEAPVIGIDRAERAGLIAVLRDLCRSCAGGGNAATTGRLASR